MEMRILQMYGSDAGQPPRSLYTKGLSPLCDKNCQLYEQTLHGGDFPSKPCDCPYSEEKEWQENLTKSEYYNTESWNVHPEQTKEEISSRFVVIPISLCVYEHCVCR